MEQRAELSAADKQEDGVPRAAIVCTGGCPRVPLLVGSTAHAGFPQVRRSYRRRPPGWPRGPDGKAADWPGDPGRGSLQGLPGREVRTGPDPSRAPGLTYRHSAQTPARRKPLTMEDDPENTLICCCPLGSHGGRPSQANVAAPSARRACGRGGERTPGLSSRPVGSKSLSSVLCLQS